MKKHILVLIIIFIGVSCANNDSFVLQNSIGKDNRLLVVISGSNWVGDVGTELKSFLGEPMIGLPQPEPQLTLSQVAPNGFSKMMKISRNILVVEESDTENFAITHNKYAQPQTIVYLTAKDKKGLLAQLKKHNTEILQIFKSSDIEVVQKRFASKRIDDSKYKTLQNLNISLTIPENFRTVDDTGEFLWLRYHLKSGIARGAGSNNLLVYTLPLTYQDKVTSQIGMIRDSIGQRYIPGSKEDMYMITEKAYTPQTIDTEIKGLQSFETRGKWEVKNDFMAGPFLNYTIVDKAHNRLLVIEGFTYAPSVNKRDFVFELEAIAKSLQIKETSS